jgi:Fe-S-cluster containining protein
MDGSFKAHRRQDDPGILRREWTPLEEGDRWQCIMCGWCCRQAWAVNVTWAEFDRARSDPRFSALRIDRLEVEEGTGRTHPYFVIDGACPLLDRERDLCSVHPDWFFTCATWPFLLLPDGGVMVNRSCRGFGSGPLVDREEVVRKVSAERARAGIAAAGD